ncbi:MAG: GLUG motif-containing protein [Phycisphaerales bacterium]|jgi:hypothetical protein
MRGKTNHVTWLLCALFLTWPVQAKYGGGSGTSEDPYLIYTAEQMNTIGTEPNDWDKQFKLMADIDLSSYTGTDFHIIGTSLRPAFTGVFDGDGHTISNFTYTSTYLPSIGIFGNVDGPNAHISNLGLIDPNVDAGSGVAVGSLAGWLRDGAITNCHAEDGSVSGRAYVGGLVGANSGAITDCHMTGNVTGSYRVGGLVGENGRLGGRRNTGIVERCFAIGGVTGGWAVGGLVGENQGEVRDCQSSCLIDGEDEVGGLVGFNWGAVVSCYSNCIVDGRDNVGGLVGQNDGSITASCSYASVRGREEVGGLVGRNSDSAETVNCYANGNVVGQLYAGGLVGSNATDVPRAGAILSGTIRNCYSTTAVSAGEQVGGLVGRNGDGEVSASFWDVETSGQTVSFGGTGKTTAEMQDANTFIDAGWDFVGPPGGPDDVWAEPEEGGYPTLWWQLSPLPELPAFSGGTGEPDNPYLVSTADELNSIGHNPRLMAAHFKLIADIDLAGVDLFIIGKQWYPFRGTFDGNGHTISNLSYTFANAACVGLFGYAVGAEIKNLGLIGPNLDVEKGSFHGSLVGFLDAGVITNCYVEAGSVSGNDYVGGLVGENSPAGTVTNCRSNCNVDGRDNVGGLAGRNGGTIVASYSHASVNGRNAIGGLVGRHYCGETVNCYARGDVAGQWYVGGLVGTNGPGTRGRTGAIHNCYSATAILGGAQKGGLLGADWGGEVHDSFWDIETSGRTTSYGGTGKTTAEMQAASTFLEASWDFVAETENGAEDIWNICEGQDYPRLTWQLTVGDFDNDGDVDFNDYALLASRWHKTDGSFSCGGGGTDLTNDGYVDFADLALMILYWSEER